MLLPSSIPLNSALASFTFPQPFYPKKKNSWINNTTRWQGYPTNNTTPAISCEWERTSSSSSAVPKLDEGSSLFSLFFSLSISLSCVLFHKLSHVSFLLWLVAQKSTRKDKPNFKEVSFFPVTPCAEKGWKSGLAFRELIARGDRKWQERKVLSMSLTLEPKVY